jgi:hypothetical protein
VAALSPTAHRVLRISLLLVMAGGVGLLMHRTRRSEEQVELTRYVERELPPLLDEEQAIAESLSALLAEQKLPAAAARKQLVDEITPRLVKLRRRAEALAPQTVTVRQLAALYLSVLDGWTEAARTAVRAIDDPSLSTEAGLLAVRERLREAASQSRTFGARLVETCTHHHLAPPHR